MDWFLYDNGLRHERVKRAEKFRGDGDNFREENIYVNAISLFCTLDFNKY